jgi:hypothetical protein
MYTMENDQESQQQSYWEQEEPITEPPFASAQDTELPPEQPVNFDVYFVARPDQQPTKPQRRAVPRSLLVVVLAVMVVATLSGVAAAFLSSQVFAPAVTITLVPQQQTVTTEQTVTVVLGKAQANQIQGRPLPTVAMSQQQTVATKIGHLPARVATGRITFYNGLPSSQRIPAGTLLTTADGIQIVTDTDAFIPPASIPVEGQISVLAHSVQPGAFGNIPAYAINGACCRIDVFARNLTNFSGGQDAKDVPLVTKNDVDNATRMMQAPLMQSITTALQTQLKPSESLLVPPCTETTKPDVPVGTPASQVTVTLSESCQAIAYDTATLNQQVNQAQTKQATTQLDSHYRLSGTVQTTVRKVTAGKQSYTLTVQSRGLWTYQLTPELLAHLSQSIAGTQKDAARSVLLRTPGIAQVALNTSSDSLPSDPAKIHFLVMASGT